LISSRKSRIWVAASLTAALQIAAAGCTGGHSVSTQTEGHQSMNPPDANITASVSGDDILVTVVVINHAVE
jgi:hypothetical protein